MQWLIKNKKELIVTSLFCAALFFSTYKLSESPPTWLDEGMIVQTSKTLVEEGVYSVKVAPDTYISPGFISTSYPVTFPIALSFKLFGVGLLQARSVMVIYILAFLLSIYFLAKRLFKNEWLMIAGLALLVSFPPLYGNGKNVLGEVPGLFFLTVFLIFIDRIWKGDRRISQFILAGLTLGLCIATKPIFILLLPVVAMWLLYVWLKKPEVFGRGIIKNSLYFIVCALLPLVAWIMIQFRGDSFVATLSYYANPHSVNLATSLLSNIKAFLTAPESLYFFALYLVWLTAVTFRVWSKKNIEVAELVAFGFSTLVLLAYFRNPAYYRYFFLAEVYCLLFFVQTLNFIIGTRPKAADVTSSTTENFLQEIFLRNFLVKISCVWSRKSHRPLSGAGISIFVIVFALIIFQSYQLLFHSWVSQYYGSTKTRDCVAAIGKIPQAKSIFFYQDPELVIFRAGGNYYQYMDSIETDQSRTEKKRLIKQGVPDIVAVSSEIMPQIQDILEKYVSSSSCDRYQILNKK